MDGGYLFFCWKKGGSDFQDAVGYELSNIFLSFLWCFKIAFEIFMAFLFPNMWETSNPPTIQEYLSKSKNKNLSNKQTKTHLKSQESPTSRPKLCPLVGRCFFPWIFPWEINSPCSGQVCGPSTSTWKVRNSQWFRGWIDGGRFLGDSWGFTMVSLF